MDTIRYSFEVAAASGRAFAQEGERRLSDLEREVASAVRTTPMEWQARASAAGSKAVDLADQVEIRIPERSRPVYERAFAEAVDKLICWQVAAGKYQWDQFDGAVVVIRLNRSGFRHWLQSADG